MTIFRSGLRGNSFFDTGGAGLGASEGVCDSWYRLYRGGLDFPVLRGTDGKGFLLNRRRLRKGFRNRFLSLVPLSVPAPGVPVLPHRFSLHGPGTGSFGVTGFGTGFTEGDGFGHRFTGRRIPIDRGSHGNFLGNGLAGRFFQNRFRTRRRVQRRAFPRAVRGLPLQA